MLATGMRGLDGVEAVADQEENGRVQQDSRRHLEVLT
jgi:hypothetical protein